MTLGSHFIAVAFIRVQLLCNSSVDKARLLFECDFYTRLFGWLCSLPGIGRQWQMTHSDISVVDHAGVLPMTSRLSVFLLPFSVLSFDIKLSPCIVKVCEKSTTVIAEIFVRVKIPYSGVRDLSYAINFRTAGTVSHTLLCVHGFRMLLNFVLSAESTKSTKLNCA